MKELLIQLRAMQMFAQSAHHLVGRVAFFSDHEFFGDAYEAHAKDYDDVAERIVGLQGEMPLELNSIIQGVVVKLQGCPSIGVKENSMYFMHQLKYEQELCAMIGNIIKMGVSQGTAQLIGDIANASEKRIYRIKQRLKK